MGWGASEGGAERGQARSRRQLAAGMGGATAPARGQGRQSSSTTGVQGAGRGAVDELRGMGSSSSRSRSSQSSGSRSGAVPLSEVEAMLAGGASSAAVVSAGGAWQQHSPLMLRIWAAGRCGTGGSALQGVHHRQAETLQEVVMRGQGCPPDLLILSHCERSLVCAWYALGRWCMARPLELKRPHALALFLLLPAGGRTCSAWLERSVRWTRGTQWRCWRACPRSLLPPRACPCRCRLHSLGGLVAAAAAAGAAAGRGRVEG